MRFASTCVLLMIFCLYSNIAVGQSPDKTSAEKAEEETAQKSESNSIKKGLNDRFVSIDLDVEEWLGRFEIESREAFSAREQVLKACEIKPGMKVADVGAGTGFYSKLFSQSVGDGGWVYAVDISPRFLEHITQRMKRDKIENVTAVYCRDDSVDLPPNSVDVVFVCDTYHHFEFYARTLASIHRALTKDGVLVIVDFERIPGISREWVLNHVRCGKSKVTEEVQAVGFGLEAEVPIEGFKENYLLRFRKR